MHSLLNASCEPALLLADLANLPTKPPRSKQEPHRELIRELRRSGRTNREVARVFSDRLGFHVAPSTLHSFVKVRARHRKQVQFELPPLMQVVAEGTPSSGVAALKAKPPAGEAKRTRFVFRENEPLTLSSDGGGQ